MEALAKVIEKVEDIDDRLAEGSQKFALHQRDIEYLQEWQERQNGSIESIDATLKKIIEKINELNLAIVGGRPSWAISLIMSFLLALSTGLFVYVAKGG